MQINIGIEVEYLEICLKLDSFGIFIDRFEKSLKYLTDQEILRTSHSLRKLRDITDITTAQYDLEDFVNHIIPLFFRNSSLVSLWAIYESAIIVVADHLQRKNHKSQKLKKFRENERMSLLDRAYDYFQQVLKVKLYSDDHQERLDQIRVLRNAIAHCNGRLEDVGEDNKKKFKEWMKQNIGINIYHGDLLISESFLRKTYLIVKKSLCDLIKCVSSQ